MRYLFALEDTLREKLRARGRETWAQEEMPALVELRTYRNDPRRLYLRVSGNARMNRRELGILNELAHLRDRYARERNIPLKYVLPDDVMVGLVQLRPKSVDELSQLRRIDAGTRRNLGERIVEAVRRGEAIPDDELPPRAPKPLGPQREALVSTMAVLVSALAAENDLPTTLLLPRAALERIAREAPQTPEALGDVVNLTSWRRQLVVEPLWRDAQRASRCCACAATATRIRARRSSGWTTRRSAPRSRRRVRRDRLRERRRRARRPGHGRRRHRGRRRPGRCGARRRDGRERLRHDAGCSGAACRSRSRPACL